MPHNIPLLRKTMEHIEAHPGEWNQMRWAERTACGTVMCFAGTLVTLTGHELRFRPDGSALLTADGRWIEDVAREEAGLTAVEATGIFHCYTRDPAVLRARVERVTGERL